MISCNFNRVIMFHKFLSCFAELPSSSAHTHRTEKSPTQWSMNIENELKFFWFPFSNIIKLDVFCLLHSDERDVKNNFLWLNFVFHIADVASSSRMIFFFLIKEGEKRRDGKIWFCCSKMTKLCNERRYMKHEMLILAYILLIEVSTSLKHQTNFLMACTKCSESTFMDE